MFSRHYSCRETAGTGRDLVWRWRPSVYFGGFFLFFFVCFFVCILFSPCRCSLASSLLQPLLKGGRNPVPALVAGCGSAQHRKGGAGSMERVTKGGGGRARGQGEGGTPMEYTSPLRH